MALLGQNTFSVRKETQGIKKIYTRSQLQPITPIGDNPIGWSAVPSTFDAPPNYGNLWSSSATIDPNGVVQGTWTTPTLEEPYTSNPLDRFPFVVGTGNQYPYTQDGTDNIREIGLNPFGVSDVIWRGKSHISTGWCGGLTISPLVLANSAKMYRMSCWIKRNSQEGSFYISYIGEVQIAPSWENRSSGYLYAAMNLPKTNQWYLFVWYYYPALHQDDTIDPRAGFYDPLTGNKIYSKSRPALRQQEINTSLGFAIKQYNCPTTDPEIRLWQPRIDLCDGREPSIEQLLKGSPKTPTITISGETVFKFSSGQTVPENTSIALSAELTNGATTYQWQYFRISDSTWVNLSSGTSQTYSLPHNSSAFQSTSRIQIRCTTVVAGATYTSNVLTITKVYDGIAGSNQAPLFLYKRSSTSPAIPTNTAVWAFATASYSTAPNNGWETSIPASNGTPCWVIQAVASGNGATDTIAPTDWSNPRVLVQDGITSTLLDLTNETTVVSVDYNGNPIGSIETTQANVYEGNQLASGWTLTKVDSGCVSSIVGGVVTVSVMSADKATVTVKANKTGYSELTAVYSLTKLYPAKDGLPTPVYSLLPAHSSISKSKTGILTPSTTSCKVKLSVDGQTEIVGDDPKIMYKGRNLMKQPLSATGYSGATTSFDLADTALVPTEWNAVGARRLITTGGTSILKIYFGTPAVALGIIRSSSVYVKNMGSTDVTVHSNLGGIGVNVSAGESKRVLMPNIVGNGSGSLQFQFRTLLVSDNIDCIIYGFQTEENSYCTPFTFAPEDYNITRNDSATDVTWSLIDPKGTTVDTERIPIVVDGSDGINGNNGLNNTIVTLYQRSDISTPEVPPAKPSTGTIVYNFSNLTVSGDLAGWQIDAPPFEAGTKLFKIAASVASYTTTTSIIPLAWVGPVKTEDTEASDLLRGDFTAEIERLDDRIGLEVEGVYTNGLGLVVQQNKAAIQVVDDSVDIKVSAIKVGGSNLFKLTDLEQGTIYANGGLDVALNKVRSKTFIPFTATQITVNAYSAHKPTVIFYNSSYASLGRTYEMDGSTYPTYPKTYDAPSGTAFIKVTVNRSDNSNFLPDQARTEVRVKIEEGNKATSYTESGDDLLTDLSSSGINVTSKRILLNGNTEVVDSSGSVSKFSDGTFLSKRLITGVPGTDRIEIDGTVADPSISIIDSTDAVKVEISPKQIQTLTEIANAGGSSALTLHSSAIVSLSLSSTGSLTSDLGSVYNFSSLSFVMGKLGTIVTPAFSYSLIANRYTPDVDSYSTVSIDLQRYNGTSWIPYASVLNDMAIDSSKSTAGKQYHLYNIPAGTYRFLMEITIQKGDEATVSAQVSTTLNAPYTLSYPVQKTTIGKDGIAMVWSTSQYARYGADGMEVRYGNYGLRVNNSGIQKTVNGGTWTNL